MLIGLIIFGVFLIVILWTVVEQKQLVVTNYQVESDRLPEAFHNTSFVILSDLHNRCFGKNNERLIKKITGCSPEFILVAGDMIDKRKNCYPGDTYSLLEQLSQKYKIYYAYGNHEQRMDKLLTQNSSEIPEEIASTWVEYKIALLEHKVTLLDNTGVCIIKGGDKLRITGVSIAEKYFVHGKLKPMEEGYLTSLVGNKPEQDYQIMIAHNPAYFHEYVRWGADLIVSGHIHGGMVRLPLLGGLVSPQVRLFPKYSSGIHSENGQKMIVSRGLGSHSLMPRLFNIPEIVRVTLKNKEKM